MGVYHTAIKQKFKIVEVPPYRWLTWPPNSQILECYPVENIMANRPLTTYILFHFNIYYFSLKWQDLITYAGDGRCMFIITLGISLTTLNKKSISDFLLLKFFTGLNPNDN